MYRIILFITILSFVISCKKNNPELLTGDFRFRNNTDKPVNVDIYPSIEDYSNVTNLIRKIRVEAHGSVTIPLADFESGKEYYTDWYSDDYTISNWVMPPENTNVYHYVKITPFLQPSYTIQHTPDFSLIRKALLNNTESSTIWDAVALTDGNGKGKYPLPPGNKLEITFRKNRSYTLVNQQNKEDGFYETEFYGSVQLNGSQKGAILRTDDSATSLNYQFADTMVYYDFFTSTGGMYLIVKRK